MPSIPNDDDDDDEDNDDDINHDGDDDDDDDDDWLVSLPPYPVNRGLTSPKVPPCPPERLIYLFTTSTYTAEKHNEIHLEIQCKYKCIYKYKYMRGSHTSIHCPLPFQFLGYHIF